MKTEDSLEDVKQVETITDTVSAGRTSLSCLKLNFYIMTYSKLKDSKTINLYYFYNGLDLGINDVVTVI